jgi:HAD superfamily hydrolase (TIGR01509 family)
MGLTMDRRSDRKAGIIFVIFDMDGVLAHLDRDRRLQWLARTTGKSPAHFNATVWHSDFEAGAEAGAYPTAAGYLAEFNRRSGCSLSREQWIEARRQAMTLIPETLAIARELRDVAGIALLTNNGSLLRESLPELVPEVCELFGDALYASCEFQARKPDRQVFERLLARHAVAHEQALLIDDDSSNVQGARHAGLHALLFQDPARLREELVWRGLLNGQDLSRKAPLPGTWP